MREFIHYGRKPKRTNDTTRPPPPSRAPTQGQESRPEAGEVNGFGSSSVYSVPTFSRFEVLQSGESAMGL